MRIVEVLLAQLKRDAPMTGITEGHASTSVYQSTTDIRNNLVILFITKVNIFLKHGINCYEWKPSEKVFKSRKSITQH